MLDLFQKSWVLLSEDDEWAQPVAQTAARLGVAVQFVHIGTDVKTQEPHAFQGAYGLESDGATLVRPDGYIAWRTVSGPGDKAGTLADVLSRVSK